jgi:hypothetical protein
VNAAATGRPTRELEADLRYLKDLVDASGYGSALVARYVTANPAVLAGQPVYYDTAQLRFDLAFAAVSYDAPTGTISAAPSADCLGVCLAKHSDTLVDVLLWGRQVLDVSAATGPNPAAGRYYLSGTTPGLLTRQSPAISVPVLFLAPDGTVTVNPAPRDFLTQHVHYKFDLHCLPAGTTSPPGGGGRHTITSPNVSLPGWLPASHASFGGHAPTGAAWGYNLAAHPQLQRTWPPIPIESAVLFWDKGTGGTLVPTGLNGGLAVLDQYGIWWMSDCNGDVPWPATYNSASPPDPPAADTDPPTCPRPTYMWLKLGFVADLFATRTTLVTKLSPGSPKVTIVGPDAAPATTGPLTIDVDLDLAVSPTNVAGAIALKSFGNSGFTKGYVTEALIQGSGLSLTSTNPDTTTSPGTTLHKGTVTVGLSPNPVLREVPPAVIRLADAEEHTYQNLPVIALPAGRTSGVYYTFAVPPDGLPGSPTFTMRLVVTGISSGSSVANITAAYRRIPDAPTTPATIPTSDTPLTFASTTAVGVTQQLRADSAAFAVAAGDRVLVSIVGTNLGILSATGILGGS